MLKLRKVAITGSPASGKSSVCRFLKELGAYIVSADEIVHQLLSQDQDLKRKMIELLGKEVLTDNHIDRKKIANKIFNHIEKLQAVESIIHPKVREHVNQIYNQIKKQSPQPSLFAVEIPLLFESGMDSDFEISIAVVSKIETSRKRYAGPDFDHRKARFFSEEKLKEKADYVIENEGTLDELNQATTKVFHQICHQISKKNLSSN